LATALANLYEKGYVTRKNAASASGAAEMSDKCPAILTHGRITFLDRINAMFVARTIDEIPDQGSAPSVFDNRRCGCLDVTAVIGGITFKYETFHHTPKNTKIILQIAN
jgi:hypothetical protein